MAVIFCLYALLFVKIKMSDIEACNLARNGKVTELVSKINADPGLIKLKDSVCTQMFFVVSDLFYLVAEFYSICLLVEYHNVDSYQGL